MLCVCATRLMLHICATRFDVIGNFEKLFRFLVGTKQGHTDGILQYVKCMCSVLYPLKWTSRPGKLELGDQR